MNPVKAGYGFYGVFLFMSDQSIEFYWEDVKAIHCDEIEIGSGSNFALSNRSESKGQTSTKKIYQMALVVNASKKPFIVQCPTSEGLAHLVSAFEFWIGAGNKGKQAPISGMPYLSQGLRLDSDGKVALLWAGSPCAKATGDGPGDLAVELGDGIWSLDTDTSQPQGKPNLEEALQSLVPGRHTLYVVAPADWVSRPPANNIRSTRVFNPKRQKMELLVP